MSRGNNAFTLLVARLVEGDESKTIPLSEVEDTWNKMTDRILLGMKFNRLYTSEAKNNDWVLPLRRACISCGRRGKKSSDEQSQRPRATRLAVQDEPRR